MSFAKGKYAFGFCDKTGFRYPLKDLVDEYRNGTKTGFRVGRDVVDPDQPQNFLGRLKIFDPQSLRNPRPDPRVEPETQHSLPPNPFTTSVAFDIVYVNEPNHGRTDGATIVFYGAEAFAGVSASVLNKIEGYTINVLNTDTYTITLPVFPPTITSSEQGGGNNVYAGPPPVSYTPPPTPDP